MATNREIVFSARDNGVEREISKIRNSARDLGRDLAKEASANTDSARDAVKYYEEQVKLIEKRNLVEARSARIAAESKRNRKLDSSDGDTAKIQEANREFSQTIRDVSLGSKEDQLQVDLLRELIDAVKTSSRDEIRSDDVLANADRVHEERLSNDEFNQLGDRLRDEAQYNSSGKGSQGKGVTGISTGGAGNIASGLSDAMDSRTAMGTAGSMMGMLSGRAGVYGAAAYGGLKLGQGVALAGRDREMELRELASVSGISVNDLMGLDVGGSTNRYGASDLNVSRAEFRERIAPQTARNYGSVEHLLGSRGRGMRDLEVEKGMGVDSGIVGSLAKLTRVVTNSGDAQDQAQILYRRMDAEGAYGKTGGDMSRASDIMQSFVDLQNANFMRSGSMSGSGMVMDLMGRFEALGGAYKSDQYKTSTIQSLDAGLSQGGSSEANAIKMGILRRLNPEKGFFDLQVEMEKGIGSKGYLQNVLKYVRNTGGDDNAQKILLNQLTGGQMRGSDIKRMIETGEFDSVGLGGAYTAGGDREFDFRGKAVSSSSEKETYSMVMEESIADLKDSLAKNLDTGFKGLGKKFDELISLF